MKMVLVVSVIQVVVYLMGKKFARAVGKTIMD
jgi:hypothetical protein